MDPLRIQGGPAIECVTLTDGPPGIENQGHVEQVVPLIGAMVRKRDTDCSAFVIACYSDPGLHAARELTTKPVLGIAECGILTALTLGQRFGVISILRKSIPRHLRYVGQMGLNDRMAGDRAIGLGVVALADDGGLCGSAVAWPMPGHTVVIDVRTPAELALSGHIDAPLFFNITRGQLEFQIEVAVPDKTTPIVVYCGVSQRSPLAADTLMKLGYKNVKNYRDGFFNWKRAGLPLRLLDKAPASFLYDLPQEVIPGVWSAIGATAPGTYVNSGHNNNLSFVITDDGVLVVNAGDNYLLAQSLHEEIKKRTTQPVKYVVLENSQGHAMLGSKYWKEQGATIIAQRDTAAYMEKTGYDSLEVMRSRARDKAFKTEFVMPDRLYDDKLELKMGTWNLQILHLGSSHSHGDTMVWLPEKKLVIAGDTAGIMAEASPQLNTPDAPAQRPAESRAWPTRASSKRSWRP